MISKNRVILQVIILFLSCFSLLAQGSSGSKATYETRYIVDMPTAGVLPKSGFSVYSQFFTQGGMLIELAAAPFTNFNFGISYSGINIIGEGDIQFQKLPGVQIRWRLIDETKLFPAILIGLNTQGRGYFHKDYQRFQTLYPGIYGAVSKNFTWALGSLALHGGLNYSFENRDTKGIPDIWAGIEQSISSSTSINLEYNTNLDEDHKVMSTKGLLNASIRMSFIKGLTFELIFRDLFNNTKNISGFERWLGLEFINNF